MANVKKLSVSTIHGKIDLKKVLNSDKAVPIMRVIGQAVSSKRGESAYGPWTALLGQFRATNLADGEQSDGAVLHLPDVAMTPILVALASGPVTFAIELQVQKSTSGKAGGSPYEYAFTHLLPPSDNDPLAMLEKQLLALAAPDKKDDDKKDDPTPTKGKGK